LRPRRYFRSGNRDIHSMSEYRFSRSAAIQPSAIRELLRDAHRPGMISLAGGLPQAALFDVEGIRHATAAVLEQQARTALQYGATEGQESLQGVLSAHMLKRGIRVSPASIQVTTGSQQALDLIARAFLDEGDCVALEVPNYLAAVQVFDLHGACYLSLPAASDGAEVERLTAQLAAHRGPHPKLAYLVSNFSNPTGASW
jgi:2-aminoadipate transaminase